MRRVLFVKSGRHDDPVTRSTEVDDPTIRDLIATAGAPRYLGVALPELPARGDATRMSGYAGPDHVVLELPADGVAAELNGAGFYLLATLHPSSRWLQNTLRAIGTARLRAQTPRDRRG